MKKILSLLVITFMLLFAACSNAQETTTPTQSSTPVVQEASPSNQETPQETQVENQEEDTSNQEETPQVQEEEEEEVSERKGDEIVDETQAKIDSLFEDGSYSKDGSYTSPAGQDSVTVTVSLENDVITSISVEALEASSASKGYIKKFASGIEEHTIGKKINELDVPTRISGSSLTIDGFNNAIDKILKDAN